MPNSKMPNPNMLNPIMAIGLRPTDEEHNFLEFVPSNPNSYPNPNPNPYLNPNPNPNPKPNMPNMGNICLLTCNLTLSQTERLTGTCISPYHERVFKVIPRPEKATNHLR